jgi:septum formation protein
LGADTIVAIDDQILGKPRNRNSARSMLEQLSGQTHQVYTGFSICHRDGITHHTEVVATDVTFKSLSKEEIDWYIHTDEPLTRLVHMPYRDWAHSLGQAHQWLLHQCRGAPCL